jgi:hypothetical protein
MKRTAPWQRIVGKVPFPALVIGTVVVVLAFIGILIQALRPKPLDFNSPDIFSQVPTEVPLKPVTAQQVVDYLQGHGVAVSDVKPYTGSRLKAGQALALNVQDQHVAILSYDDMKALLSDRALLINEGNAGITAAGRDGATLAAPTARPTDRALSERWNADSLGNVLLLTDKNMAAPLRSALLSHLTSLVVASVRPNFPTPTPG